MSYEVGKTYYFSQCPYCQQWFRDDLVNLDLHMPTCESRPTGAPTTEAELRMFPPSEVAPSEVTPKACIIATVFLGQQHPLLAPMRKFRDAFIPKSMMNVYYRIGTWFLRKIGRLR